MSDKSTTRPSAKKPVIAKAAIREENGRWDHQNRRTSESQPKVGDPDLGQAIHETDDPRLSAVEGTPRPAHLLSPLDWYSLTNQPLAPTEWADDLPMFPMP
jgi:hypothetical protein